jgi:hypothetical protein
MTLRPGFPIRKSADQRLLASPRGLSQRATSFIASQCQGIHQMPFLRLIQSSRPCRQPPRHSQHFSNLMTNHRPAPRPLDEEQNRTSGVYGARARDLTLQPVTHGKTPAVGRLHPIHNVKQRRTGRASPDC